MIRLWPVSLSIVARLRDYLAYRRAYQSLARLSDRSLADLGIPRGEIGRRLRAAASAHRNGGKAGSAPLIHAAAGPFHAANQDNGARDAA
jgi:uncharacterized protein YjiS (DUF1127 family)